MRTMLKSKIHRADVTDFLRRRQTRITVNQIKDMKQKG